MPVVVNGRCQVSRGNDAKASNLGEQLLFFRSQRKAHDGLRQLRPPRTMIDLPVGMPLRANGPLPGFAGTRMLDGALPLNALRLRHLAVFSARRKALPPPLHRSWFQGWRRTRTFGNPLARDFLWDIEPHQSASRLS